VQQIGVNWGITAPVIEMRAPSKLATAPTLAPARGPNKKTIKIIGKVPKPIRSASTSPIGIRILKND
jgi:hypothetical protein